jgi:hypothetical protein
MPPELKAKFDLAEGISCYNDEFWANSTPHSPMHPNDIPNLDGRPRIDEHG